MRLRYLHLRDAPPLQRLAIPFWQESVLGRACAIRFVVGVNGSGKSRLLQALAQLFLALERDTPLPFFVTLAYDLGSGEQSRTIFLQYQPNEEGNAPDEPLLLEFERLDQTREWDWEQLRQQVTARRRYKGAREGARLERSCRKP